MPPVQPLRPAPQAPAPQASRPARPEHQPPTFLQSERSAQDGGQRASKVAPERPMPHMVNPYVPFLPMAVAVQQIPVVVQQPPAVVQPAVAAAGQPPANPGAAPLP